MDLQTLTACLQLVELLQGTLQPQQAVIEAATSKLLELESAPGYGVALTLVLANREVNEPVRQAAGLYLRRYCQHHWTDESDDHFFPPAVPDSDRDQIRQVLPTILLDPSSKLRTAASLVIGAIAHEDYPERWPALLDTLMDYMMCEDVLAVQGAIRALVLFAEDIQEHQLPLVAQALFPVLLRVLEAAQVFAPRVRMRAITVYRNCVVSLFERVDDDANSSAAQRLLAQTLPAWMDAFRIIFADTSVPELGLGFGVRLEAIKTLRVLVQHAPKAISKFMPTLSKSIWDLLVAATAPFVSQIVNADDPDSLDAAVVDDEGDSVGVEAFIDQTLDLFGAMSQSSSKAVRGLVDQPEALQQLVGLAIALMQITSASMQQWQDDPNEFVAAEEDLESGFSVRAACKVLITNLIDAFDNSTVQAISVSAAAALSEAATQGVWKLREAAVLAVGLVAEQLPEVWKEMEKRAKRARKLLEKKQKAAGKAKGKGNTGSSAVELDEADAAALAAEAVALNIPAFIGDVLLPDLLPSAANELVRARALWCAGEYAESIPAELQEAVLQRFVAALPAGQPLPVRLCAARSFGELVLAFPLDLVQPALPRALGDLCTLLAASHDETLHMVLDTISVALQRVDPTVAAAAEPSITPLLLQAWSRHTDDRLVAECVVDVFRALCDCASCVPGLQSHALPTLLQILAEPARWPPGVLHTAMMLLQLVLAASQALPADFVQQVLPLVLQLGASSDDHSVMQAATAAAATFVQKAGLLIVSQPSLVNSLFQLAAHMLDPQVGEEGANVVGRLLAQLLVHCSAAFESSGGQAPTVSLRDVIQAALARLQAASNPHLIRSLLLFFARFINHSHSSGVGVKAALDLLSSLPNVTLSNPRDVSALVVSDAAPFSSTSSSSSSASSSPSVAIELPAPLALLVKWALNHSDLEVMSPYYMRASVHALALLLLDPQTALLQSELLQRLLVKGYALVDPAQKGPATRSKGEQAVQYQYISLSAKLLSLLLASLLQTAAKQGGDVAAALGLEADAEDDDDDDEDDWDDEDGDFDEFGDDGSSPFVDADEYAQRAAGGGGMLLSERLDLGFLGDEQEEEEEEDLDSSDAVASLDLVAFERPMLQHAAQLPCFNGLAQQLSSSNQDMLRRVLGLSL